MILNVLGVLALAGLAAGALGLAASIGAGTARRRLATEVDLLRKIAQVATLPTATTPEQAVYLNGYRDGALVALAEVAAALPPVPAAKEPAP